MDIYTPRGQLQNPMPVVAVIHGGGWIGGDKTEQTYFCAKLARNGYIVCAINYRLAPRHQFPAAVEDCAAALAWARANIASYHGNPSQIFLAGSSAGAYLAALTASHDVSKTIKGLILYYGVYDLQTVQAIPFPFLHTYLQAFLGASRVFERERLVDASPTTFVSAALPPVLAIASECDTLHPQTLQYIAALQKAGVPCTLFFLNKAHYPHAPHGFQPLPINKAARDAFTKVTAFLARL